MPFLAERRQILFRQPEQTHRGRESSSVLRMRGMFEMLLQMDERAGGLDQPFEILGVLRRRSSLSQTCSSTSWAS